MPTISLLWYQKLSVANTGKKLTQETKDKISRAHLGRKRPVGTGDKISKALKGKVNRKLDKWPCFDGWKCRCQKCKDLRNKMNKSYLVKENAII